MSNVDYGLGCDGDDDDDYDDNDAENFADDDDADDDVDDESLLLMSDQKAQIQCDTVNTTQHIPFSGLRPAKFDT